MGALCAVAVATALSTVGVVLAQGVSAPVPGGAAPSADRGSTSPDAATQPGAVDSLSREEFRGDPFTLVAPGSNPFGTVQSGMPFGIPSGETGAVGLRVGGGTLYPALALRVGYDDNIFFTDANKQSSWISVVTPVLRYEARTRNATYDLVYKGDYGNYWDSSADNYNDHLFLAQGNWTISGRAGFRLRGEYFKGHDPRGSTDRAVSSEPDRFDAKSVSGLFLYGAEGARGRIELEGGYLDKTYQNNRLTTTFGDRDVAFGSGTFIWRVMPKTSLLFQVKDTEIDYKVDTQALDSSELRFLVGATWEATAKTTGIFRIGQVRKDFDSPLRQDFTGIGWEGTIRWSPLTYSTFTFSTAREPTESTGTADFILSQIHYLSWAHAWTERVQTTLSAGYRTDDYRGAGATRSDDIATAGARVSYRLRRWLSVAGDYTYTDRQSNVPFVEYNRNVFMLTLSATL